MSVIMESLKGDPIRIISPFTCSPVGEKFSFDTARDFSIGEIVKFIDSYKDKSSTQDYLSWFVIFEAGDGKKYTATQGSFILASEWDALTEFFKKSLQDKNCL